MKSLFANHSATALSGLVLTLPGLLMITLLLLHVEPPFAQLLPAPSNGPHVAGTLIALALIVVFPAAAAWINLEPAKASLRGGWHTAVRSVHVWLAAAALLTVLLFVGGVIADQAPCWAGVPNCD